METLTIIIVAVVAICGICAGYVYSRRMRDRSLADEWRLKYEAERRRADENARQLLAREADADEAAEEASADEASAEEERGLTAKDILMDTLVKLGCKPESPQEQRITVQYQGENFVMDCQGRLVRIWDPGWITINKDDPNLMILKEAAGETNYQWGPTIVFSDPDEENNIQIHSKYDIMVHPAVKDQDDYMSSVFKNFFDIKQVMLANYHRIGTGLQAEAQATARTRRPVGFASSQDPE